MYCSSGRHGLVLQALLIAVTGPLGGETRGGRGNRRWAPYYSMGTSLYVVCSDVRPRIYASWEEGRLFEIAGSARLLLMVFPFRISLSKSPT